MPHQLLKVIAWVLFIIGYASILPFGMSLIEQMRETDALSFPRPSAMIWVYLVGLGLLCGYRAETRDTLSRKAAIAIWLGSVAFNLLPLLTGILFSLVAKNPSFIEELRGTYDYYFYNFQRNIHITSVLGLARFVAKTIVLFWMPLASALSLLALGLRVYSRDSQLHTDRSPQ